VRLFIDTGSVAEVEEIAAWGVLSGATTNPSRLAQEQGDPGEIIERICELVDGPVSAEVVSEDPNLGAAPSRAEVLAASIRHPEHVVTAAKPGCQVATAPGKVLRQMLADPLTAAGIERFKADRGSRPELGTWLEGLLAGSGNGSRPMAGATAR
jgi:transaldolase